MQGTYKEVRKDMMKKFTENFPKLELEYYRNTALDVPEFVDDKKKRKLKPSHNLTESKLVKVAENAKTHNDSKMKELGWKS